MQRIRQCGVLALLAWGCPPQAPRDTLSVSPNPLRLGVGETGAFTVSAQLADGTTEDRTPDCTVEVGGAPGEPNDQDDAALVEPVGNGRIRGLAPGTADLRVACG